LILQKTNGFYSATYTELGIHDNLSVKTPRCTVGLHIPANTARIYPKIILRKLEEIIIIKGVKYADVSIYVDSKYNFNKQFIVIYDFDSQFPFVPSLWAYPMRNSIDSVIQPLAKNMNMSCDESIGEMRKRGCSEPTAKKTWHGEYENFKNFNEDDSSLGNLRAVADRLKVGTRTLLPELQVIEAETC
jgi:hypothetical protein